MRTTRVYFEGELESDAIILLPRETSHYLLTVLRLKMGTSLHLFNGTGVEYLAHIIVQDKRDVTVKVGQLVHHHCESPLNLHLAQAVGKGEKMDWIIQKATELGVKEITPLITTYGNVRLDDQRSAKRLAHWNKIIISAAEQCGRNQLPTLNPIQPLSSWLNNSYSSLKLLCHPEPTASMQQDMKPESVLLLVGPEGGFSETEAAQALKNGFMGFSLGPRILRMETAALVALTLAQNKWGDMHQEIL